VRPVIKFFTSSLVNGWPSRFLRMSSCGNIISGL
jgi:hypothetical protein